MTWAKAEVRELWTLTGSWDSTRLHTSYGIAAAGDSVYDLMTRNDTTEVAEQRTGFRAALTHYEEHEERHEPSGGSSSSEHTERDTPAYEAAGPPGPPPDDATLSLEDATSAYDRTINAQQYWIFTTETFRYRRIARAAMRWQEPRRTPPGRPARARLTFDLLRTEPGEQAVSAPDNAVLLIGAAMPPLDMTITPEQTPQIVQQAPPEQERQRIRYRDIPIIGSPARRVRLTLPVRTALAPLGFAIDPGATFTRWTTVNQASPGASDIVRHWGGQAVVIVQHPVLELDYQPTTVPERPERPAVYHWAEQELLRRRGG